MIGLISIIVPSQTETGLRSLFQAATPVGQKPLYLNRDSFRGSSPRLRWSYILYGEPRKLEFLNAKPEALKAQPSAQSPILRMPRVQETPKLHLVVSPRSLCLQAPSLCGCSAGGSHFGEGFTNQSCLSRVLVFDRSVSWTNVGVA